MGTSSVVSCGAALILCSILAFGISTYADEATQHGELPPPGEKSEASSEGGLEISADEAANGIVEGRFDVILDVRQPDEYEKIHILGAVPIPLNMLEKKVREKLSDLNVSILAYCRSGRRSAEAARILRKMGYTDVVSLKGGITAWKEKGYPTTE